VAFIATIISTLIAEYKDELSAIIAMNIMSGMRRILVEECGLRLSMVCPHQREGMALAVARWAGWGVSRCDCAALF